MCGFAICGLKVKKLWHLNLYCTPLHFITEKCIQGSPGLPPASTGSWPTTSTTPPFPPSWPDRQDSYWLKYTAWQKLFFSKWSKVFKKGRMPSLDKIFYIDSNNIRDENVTCTSVQQFTIIFLFIWLFANLVTSSLPLLFNPICCCSTYILFYSILHYSMLVPSFIWHYLFTCRLPLFKKILKFWSLHIPPRIKVLFTVPQDYNICVRRESGYCSIEWSVPLPYQNQASISITMRLNMEFDLQSLFGLHVHSCTHWLRHPPPPTLYIWAHIRGIYWSAKIDDISL